MKNTIPLILILAATLTGCHKTESENTSGGADFPLVPPPANVQTLVFFQDDATFDPSTQLNWVEFQSAAESIRTIRFLTEAAADQTATIEVVGEGTDDACNASLPDAVVTWIELKSDGGETRTAIETHRPLAMKASTRWALEVEQRNPGCTWASISFRVKRGIVLPPSPGAPIEAEFRAQLLSVPKWCGHASGGDDVEVKFDEGSDFLFSASGGSSSEVDALLYNAITQRFEGKYGDTFFERLDAQSLRMVSDFIFPGQSITLHACP